MDVALRRTVLRLTIVLAAVIAAVAPSVTVPPGASPSLFAAPSAAATSGPTAVAAGDLTQSVTWGPEGSPYVISGRVRIQPGAALTVRPGTVVKFKPGTGGQILVYGGQLVADGTPDKPIVFTSGDDDSVGGDSNGDGGSTAPVRGAWRSIAFSASTREDGLRAPVSVIDNVVARFGGDGYTCGGGGLVDISPLGRVMVSRSEFTDSATAGVKMSPLDGDVGVATVTTSRFARSTCGAKFDGGELSNSVFEGSMSHTSLHTNEPRAGVLTGNWFYKWALINKQPSREVLDIRNNAFIDGIETNDQSLPTDLSRNWWGWPVQAEPPWECYSAQQRYIPEVAYVAPEPPTSCGDVGSPFIVTGWRYKVTPALQQPPPQPKAGVDGVPEPPTSVPVEQLYGAGGGGSSPYGYRPAGTQADPVNTATGAFVTSAVDAVLPATGLPLAAVRSYDSADPTAGPLGRGWSFGYDIRLIEGENGTITLRSGDGQRLRYTRGADGSYAGAAGVLATLTSVEGGGWRLITPSQLRHDFNAAGRLTALRAPSGQGVDLTYDSAGRLIEVSGSGRSLRLTWDTSAERLTEVELPDGRWVGYGYTGGLLTSVRDMAGGITRYSYASGDRLTTVTSPSGRRISKQTYDATTGRVTDQWDARDNHSQFTWNPTTETASMIDSRGGVWRDVYRGNVIIRRIDPAGGTTSYEYDTQLRLIAATNPRGIRSVFGYSDAGDLVSHSGPTKAVTSVYDSNHRVIASVNARGVEVEYSYDSAGNLTAVTRPSPDGGDPLVTRYGYTDGGLLTTITDALGKTTTFDHNTSGDLVSERSPEGRTTTYTRDDAGRLTAIVDPRGNVPGAEPADFATQFTYDAADRITAVQDPLGHTSSVTFDADGLVTRVRDPKGRETVYSYDNDGHMTSVQGPDPGVQPSKATYDGNGNLLTTVDEMGRTTSYTYDLANRITKAQSPIGAYTLGYDATSNLTSITGPTGAKTQLLYDTASRLAKIDYPSGTADVSYSYDANGNRSKMTDGAGSVIYTYDELDRPTSITRGTAKFGYTWDAVGNMTGVAYPDGASYSYVFDADGLLKTASSAGTTLARYTYDEAGQLSSAELADGSTSARDYDRASRLTRLTDRTTDKTLLDETYTLDAAGNPTAVQHDDGSIDSFRYDLFDRLTKACFTASTCDDTATDFIEWAYDDTGNRTSETRPNGTTSYTYNTSGQLTKTTAPGGAITSYGYSANGLLTSAGGDTFSHNYAGRIANSTVDGVTTTFTYDGDGRRLTTSGGGATAKWAWDPLSYDLALEQDGDNATTRRYAYGASRLSMTVPGTSGAPGVGEYFYHADALGSVRSLTDTTGAEQWRYSYEPYGAARDAVKVTAAAPGNPMRWSGEYAEAGDVTHLRARQYDIATGRFGVPDPANAVSAGSTYTYANSNPLAYSDPLGLWPNWRAIASFVRDVSSVVSTVAGGAAVLLGATGIGAPLAGILGSVAMAAGATTVASSAYLAWDTCANGAKGACGDAIVSAAVDTTLGIGGAGAGALGRHLGNKVANGGESLVSQVRAGREYRFGNDLRIAPWGNRTGHQTGKYPHYHRRVRDQHGQSVHGQGISRHRPWDRKSSDTSFWDRF